METNTLKKAKDFFYNKDYQKALEIFNSLNDFYGAGLCSLLLKDTKNAKLYWKQGKKSCPGCAFGLCALGLIELKTSKLPSYFQTRAFLEVYISLLIENDCIEWAENLISCCDKLFTRNPETYKFIARALFSNGYFTLAIAFCKRSLKFFYCDPEAFLILSQCHFLLGDLGEALDCINRTLAIVSNYYPALLFKDIIKEEIKKKYEAEKNSSN